MQRFPLQDGRTTAEVEMSTDLSTTAALQRHADPLTHTSHLPSVDVLRGVGSPTDACHPAHVEDSGGAKYLAEDDFPEDVGLLKDAGSQRGVAHNRAKCIAMPDLQIGPPAAYWAAALVLAITCLVPPLLAAVPSDGTVQYHIS